MLSPLGWIARPVAEGGAADDELGPVDDEDDEVELAEDDELGGGLGPTLSCLIRSAARSAWSQRGVGSTLRPGSVAPLTKPYSTDMRCDDTWKGSVEASTTRSPFTPY